MRYIIGFLTVFSAFSADSEYLQRMHARVALIQQKVGHLEREISQLREHVMELISLRKENDLLRSRVRDFVLLQEANKKLKHANEHLGAGAREVRRVMESLKLQVHKDYAEKKRTRRASEVFIEVFNEGADTYCQ